MKRLIKPKTAQDKRKKVTTKNDHYIEPSDGCANLDRLPKTGFKGLKLNISQYRKKQSLKNQVISQQSRYQFMPFNTSTELQDAYEDIGQIDYPYQGERETIKPRKAVQTADIAFSSRMKKR